MPPKTEIKGRTLHDLNLALARTVREAHDPEAIDAEWQKLYGPARDALSVSYWRLLVAEKQAARAE